MVTWEVCESLGWGPEPFAGEEAPASDRGLAPWVSELFPKEQKKEVAAHESAREIAKARSNERPYGTLSPMMFRPLLLVAA